LLSRVLLLLAFVRLLARIIVVGVVVRCTHIVVVGGEIFVVGLLQFSQIAFISKLGFLFPICCISILGLLSHEVESFWLARFPVVVEGLQ
jgi:hypothetical protein